MATNQNIIAITGRITQNPELKYTQGGAALLSVNIANNKSYKKKDSEDYTTEVCFIECNVWGKYAESLATRLNKGWLVNVSGRLKQETWEDQGGGKRSKHTITVVNLEVVSKPTGVNSNDNSNDSKNDNQPSPPVDSDANPFSDDDIPF